MNNSSQRAEKLAAEYRERVELNLARLAKNLEMYIYDFMSGEPRVDRVTARAKSVSSFMKKANTKTDNELKYQDPIAQIQDQIGARIVVFYKNDVDRVLSRVLKYFVPIEQKMVLPNSESEFGYFGHHMILILPSDVIESDMDESKIPQVFELQIKTLFQHSWSEANHDLAYKPGDRQLTSEQKRLVAFTSAQAWGADHIFDDLFKQRNVEALKDGEPNDRQV